MRVVRISTVRSLDRSCISIPEHIVVPDEMVELMGSTWSHAMTVMAFVILVDLSIAAGRPFDDDLEASATFQDGSRLTHPAVSDLCRTSRARSPSASKNWVMLDVDRRSLPIAASPVRSRRQLPSPKSKSRCRNRLPAVSS